MRRLVFFLFFFPADAFLRHAEYFQAMLICLHAVEQNKAALLADINPVLVR